LPLNHSGMAAFQKANEIQHLRAQIVWQGFGFLINQFSGVHLAVPLNNIDISNDKSLVQTFPANRLTSQTPTPTGTAPTCGNVPARPHSCYRSHEERGNDKRRLVLSD
jgi:hypothetical protein